MWMRPTNAALLVFLTSGSQEFDNWAGNTIHTDPKATGQLFLNGNILIKIQ